MGRETTGEDAAATGALRPGSHFFGLEIRWVRIFLDVGIDNTVGVDLARARGTLGKRANEVPRYVVAPPMGDWGE